MTKMINFSFSFGFSHPYYTGPIADQKDGVRIRKVDRRRKWSWKYWRFMWARKYVVTYIATDLGAFWAFEQRNL